MKLRTRLAGGCGRFTRFCLQHIARRDASQLPGRVALALDPHILAAERARIHKGIFVVCGTNGKTTTNNLLAQAIVTSGQTLLSNRVGANMLPGVVSALLPTGSHQWATLELDELSTGKVLPELQPDYFLLLNLFRDQLDRSGEIDFVQQAIEKALLSSVGTRLVVCADDPMSNAVAQKVKGSIKEVITFGVDDVLELEQDRIQEAAFCQVCGAPLEYDSKLYAQLGNYHCPQCQFGRGRLDFAATNITIGQSGLKFQVRSDRLAEPVWLKANYTGLYMVYNILAAFVGAYLAGVSPEEFQATLDSYNPQNGRLQKFHIAGHPIVLNLAKNPTGFNQNIRLLLEDPREKQGYFLLNDHDNDGRDISWIYDVDFEKLSGAHLSKIFVSGSRGYELAVRLKYAGLEVAVEDDLNKVLQAALPEEPIYVLTNYSALWPVKKALEEMEDSHE